MCKKTILFRAVILVVAISIALYSITIASEKASSAESYTNTIQALDDKKATVMTFTATAAAASTMIAAMPGDFTNPIADQIMAISEYLFIVVCFLVLEKSLLTTLGFVAFRILIPIAAALFAVCVLVNKRSVMIFATKITVFALLLATIIPFSVKVSNLIYEANSETVEELTTEINNAIEQESDTPDNEQTQTVAGITATEQNKEEKQSWIKKLFGNDKESKANTISTAETTAEEESWIRKAFDKIEEGVSGAGESAKRILNSFIDAIALFVITYCAIPIIVIIVTIWFVKFLFNVSIPMPKLNLFPPVKKKKKCEEKEYIEV